MEQIFPENWAVLHLGLIFAVTLAQMLVVYVLSDSSNPPAGLGLFTVYFMAALLGWIAFTLQQGASTPLAVDVPAVAAILNSYILFIAAGQRAAIHAGRVLLGLACLLGCLSAFFLGTGQLFVTQVLLATVFFVAAGVVSAVRCVQEKNVGDLIIAVAAVIMFIGTSLSMYQFIGLDNRLLGQVIAFGAHSWAYVLVAVGFLASVLIEYQQHLSHLATEDPLTRLLNRRGLEDAMRVSMAHASRHDLPTAAIVIDVDHFKQVNDSFGHDTGDQVIRRVAAMIERMCRASDVLARTGGEEFLVILTDTDQVAARSLAERICHAIGERPLLVDQQRIPVTVSLGVAATVGEVDLDALTQEADQAMYLAKRSGRNRVASVESAPVHLSNSAAEA
ncbi:GGDEF domain-containing protein [Seongchinamella unica]|uniref:diguanylate cyclase n=1 Tax=Seongchinamella unica TaxID=2547392 RepID=A0A4R5LP70_9GAMM|nr:GGDEF domain-containing protein [Seongchinamella unica]TDG12090.1 GGDEF domain-containing protein [Seongchinamella unica]